MWELPLAADKYRKLLDSVVADMKNVGGPYAGATTAAIFLSEFVGDVPWAHIDIAGPMNVDGDTGWKSKGATGFGTRLLIDFATTFTPAAERSRYEASAAASEARTATSIGRPASTSLRSRSRTSSRTVRLTHSSCSACRSSGSRRR